MGIGRIVPTAEHIPEVPGARLIVQQEGGWYSCGPSEVLYRVLDLPRLGQLMERGRCASGLKWREDFLHPGVDILLVKPYPSQRWWRRYISWWKSDHGF